LGSDLGVGTPSLLRLVLLPWLLIRKKFLSFWGRWLFIESFECFLEEKERLEKLRLSVAMLINTLLFGEFTSPLPIVIEASFRGVHV
jgi:hypothetical protein